MTARRRGRGRGTRPGSRRVGRASPWCGGRRAPCIGLVGRGTVRPVQPPSAVCPWNGGDRRGLSARSRHGTGAAPGGRVVVEHPVELGAEPGQFVGVCPPSGGQRRVLSTFDGDAGGVDHRGTFRCEERQFADLRHPVGLSYRCSQRSIGHRPSCGGRAARFGGQSAPPMPARARGSGAHRISPRPAVMASDGSRRATGRCPAGGFGVQSDRIDVMGGCTTAVSRPFATGGETRADPDHSLWHEPLRVTGSGLSVSCGDGD